MQTQLATFGAGCFWGVQTAFKKVPGLIEVTAGYTGGKIANPSYETIIYGRTGHIEAVQVKYDPQVINYETLLELFWLVHDPTQGNRQGNDVGEEYRSAIFYHNESQKEAAKASKKRLEDSNKYSKPITTTIEPAGPFYPAEEYHQDFLAKNPGSYCHVNMNKVNEFVENLKRK